ncbi:M48 family metallopeptidase [Algihabitans albus]|uniref:M48 family metallopeptidase n=1 Tax=Algihabitans albus TaxID=2164067 RepID=UPI000E5CDA46|nr:M48 family metallopeptidase [Algihabitans albus]
MTCCRKHRGLAQLGRAPGRGFGPVLGRRQMLMGMLAGGAVGLAGCSTNPLTGRDQLMLVSDDELAAMSVSTWEQVRKEYDRGGTAGERQAVQQVGRDMVDASGLGGTRNWEFEVFEGPSNAFVLPGGQVAVFTGILEDFDNDAQMAAVVGHEVGHVAARHSAERVSQQVLASFVVGGTAAILAGIGTDRAATQIAVGALGAGATFGVLLPYSRRHELEADRLGVEYMAQKGYDPREAREFWVDRIEEREREAPAEFMSTHPSDETRIGQIEGLLPEAMEVYQQNAEAAPAPDGFSDRSGLASQGRRTEAAPPLEMVGCDLEGRRLRVTPETCVEFGGTLI